MFIHQGLYQNQSTDMKVNTVFTQIQATMFKNKTAISLAYDP